MSLHQGESELRSNGNKEVSPHSSEPQNWTLTIEYSLMSYIGNYTAQIKDMIFQITNIAKIIQ